MVKIGHIKAIVAGIAAAVVVGICLLSVLVVGAVVVVILHAIAVSIVAITDITDAVSICVSLIGVRAAPAVVTRVAEPIVVRIALVGVGHARAIVLRVVDSVAISVSAFTFAGRTKVGADRGHGLDEATTVCPASENLQQCRLAFATLRAALGDPIATARPKSGADSHRTLGKPRAGVVAIDVGLGLRLGLGRTGFGVGLRRSGLRIRLRTRQIGRAHV